LATQTIRPRVIALLTLALVGAAAAIAWRLGTPDTSRSINASQPSEFQFSLSKQCGASSILEPALTLSRNVDQSIRATFTTVMSCSDLPSDPQVLFTPKRVTLAFEETPAISGKGAACECAKSVIYDLYRPVTSGTAVVVQQAGEDVAHGFAP
jgi:hypothetical protein